MERRRSKRRVSESYEEFHISWDLPKKRKLEHPGPVRAARDPAVSPRVPALRDIGLPTPNASSLAEEEGLSKDVFPFTRLPAELRLNIYRWALCSDEPLLLNLPAKDEDGEYLKRTSTHPMNNAKVNVALLRTCSLVYKEARKVLYSENDFALSTTSGVATLAQLHQRSRSLIKSVSLAIPTHHDILDNFADLVRLGLRYCWGLKTFTIRLDVMLPDFEAGNTIYANAFRILRWLPKGCKVILEGNVNDSVKRVVGEEGRLLVELDEISYLRRQHQMCGRVSGSSFTRVEELPNGPAGQPQQAP
ncbi:hypothetical protein BU23DRAFT_571491 [Bimuria novae-zelandiae CBS 107.79]|uniref:DUF7730 domain-containing protein n=1 Tax=Bimuria novae-zelandiae CBS 107.79 TaxID=1447943 RepID=A0A6A5V3H3_9PLEO|nr:hypothetical protein BU23DRAFT_571491 [Bimuria novae-zelandiae CBS 107.79]